MDEMQHSSKKLEFKADFPLQFRMAQMPVAAALSLPTEQTLVFIGVIKEDSKDGVNDIHMQVELNNTVVKRRLATVRRDKIIPGGELSQYRSDKVLYRTLLRLGPLAARIN